MGCKYIRSVRQGSFTKTAGGNNLEIPGQGTTELTVGTKKEAQLYLLHAPVRRQTFKGRMYMVRYSHH